MIGAVEYYAQPPADYRTNYAPGQLFWAPIPFVPDLLPNRLRLDFFDPANPHNANFTIERTDFGQVPYEKDPSLRHLGLAQSEVLIANPYKKRSVVVLSDHLTRPDDAVQQYTGYMVAPSYSLHDEAGNYRQWLNRDIILRARAYQYPNIFYLPESTELALPEAFVRLDRVQFARIEHLEHRPAMLTSDATGLLREWFYHYLGCPLLNPALEKFIETTASKLTKILPA